MKKIDDQIILKSIRGFSISPAALKQNLNMILKDVEDDFITLISKEFSSKVACLAKWCCQLEKRYQTIKSAKQRQIMDKVLLKNILNTLIAVIGTCTCSALECI